jgi:uncharacterized protein (DUF58 family)
LIFNEPTPVQAEKLGRIDLIARLVVEGFLVGLHRSPYHGFSVEFAEYRHYIPGEPVTHMDWRAYARTDRHYLKVFAEETNLRATLLLDCSASMSFGSDPSRPVKAAYAKMLASALSYLLLRQNDAVGLEMFAQRRLGSVPARASRRQLFHLLKNLDRMPVGGGTGIGPVLHEVADRLPRRGLIILVSDLMDDPETIISGLKHFRHRGHEVVVFQILDPREQDLGYSGDTRFIDLENPGDTIRLQPAHIRQQYVERFDQWREDLRRGARRQRVDLVEITTDTPFSTALLAYLNKRKRMS